MDKKPTTEKDLLKDKTIHDNKRSNKWASVRKNHLKKNPSCALCGGIKKLEVHHIKPFHLYPELELDSNNLITLCEDKGDGVYCHLFFGHLGNFHSVNNDVIVDVEIWREKLKNRKNASP